MSEDRKPGVRFYGGGVAVPISEPQPPPPVALHLDVPWHENAMEERTRYIASFRENLDARAIQTMRLDGVEVVSRSHVMRSYHEIVPPGYYKRVRAAVAAAIFGAGLSTLATPFFDGDLSGDIWVVLGSVIVTLASGIWATAELRR